MKVNSVFLTIVFITALPGTIRAQDKPKDTLEVFFYNQPHKDGYQINSEIVEIPENIAVQCDKKRIRIVGKRSNEKAIYDAAHPEDTTLPRQGRYEYVPVVNDSGRVSFERRFESTGATFLVSSIYTRDRSKNKWKLVFRSGN